ncbi:MAG: phosphoribosylanthranilate isomerase [Microthrixaceae bacterium]|nr:phosphoribosylanthranilate isomerase [Microthrixaceae bacterium]
MFIKICGITNEEDALTAVGLGADALGFVFAPSVRQVTPGAARDIVKRLPPDVLTVGVFRDQSPAEVSRTVLEVGLSGAQLHGHETPAEAAEVRRAAKVLIVAFPAGDPGLAHVDDYHADAVLLDAPAPGAGHVFDWSLAESIPLGRRVILAGGLTATNVADGIATVRPWGVDVSTGVEVPGDPLRKDPVRMHEFIKAARGAASSLLGGSPFDDDAFDDGGAPRGFGRAPFDWAEQGD